ncbi:MAG: SgcJ/EcaC family oxidoreductase [Planctomycetia bacterium]|nr:SgcJ/EcaC family oxidoreductase [Planctomycetia bacterium]
MRPNTLLPLLAILCGWMTAPPLIHAAEGDEAAVRAAIDSYVEAYNRGDVEAVLAHWADDAEYLLSGGERVQGRDALREVFAESLAEENRASITVANPHVRILSDTVATEEGAATMTRTGETPEETSYLAIYVKQGDAWKLTTVRETEVQPVSISPAAEQLEQLAWLVGEWKDESEDAKVSISIRWSGNNAFLVYTFKAEAPGTEPLEGTQIIGWDPVQEVIRSWMFDSDGGFGEGVWTKDNDRWVVTFEQTLPDGGHAAATNIYTLAADNSFTWHAFQRTLNGETLPNLHDISIVRVQSEPPADTTSATPPAPADDPAVSK